MPAATITRNEAIGHIAEVFRTLGFEGASLSAITQATGLGKGSLYNYFPGGKDEMAAAVLDQVGTWFEAEVFTPLRETQNTMQALQRMFDNTERYFRSGKRICLIGAFALDATRDRFAAAVKDYFAQWVATLAATLRRAGMQKAEAVALAETVVAGIQGALVLSRALDEPDAFRRQLVQLQGMAKTALA